MSAPRTAAATGPLDLIYLLAGTTARRARSAGYARALLARTDFEQLEAELKARRLLPLIGSRILELDTGSIPPAFRAAVVSAWATARARALGIGSATRDVVELLDARGIRALPLKGPALAEDAHGDLGVRDTRDVDLLVPRERLSDAAATLVEAGYEPPRDPIRSNGLPDLHLDLARPGRPSVELHWRVHWYEDEFSAEMLDRARPGADGLVRASDRDVAVALLLFYARDGFHGVRLAADIAAWYERHQLPDGALEDAAGRHAALAPALTAATSVVDRLTGTATRRWLGSAAVGGRRVALAVRLADWTQAGDPDQMAANIALADSLLAARGAGLAAARRQLTVPAGATAVHAPKMLGRYAIALWRLRGGRTWADAPPGAPT